MSEEFCRLADTIRAKYQAVAHSGVRGGPGTGQVNAVRAEVYREILTLMLAEVLRRAPTREETVDWIAGRAVLADPLPVPAVLPASREPVDVLFASAV